MKKASTAMTSTLRCLKVLEFLAEEPFELSFTDLAAKLDIPKASAHRLCTTLIEARLITQDPGTRRYMLASHSLWIGSGYLRHSPVYRAAFFPMQQLARQLPGAVQLGVLDGDFMLVIHSVGSTGVPQAFADVGLRCPLNATASGKLFLAAMPAAQVERIMAQCSEKYTSNTITSMARMQTEIAQVKKFHYARNMDEFLPGHWVLAAPVVRPNGSLAAAISVTLPLEEFNTAQESAFSTLVKEAARKASLQLGHASTPRG